jgi:deazaflavin-dependent oxidoreductase (nitroreductase family)
MSEMDFNDFNAKIIEEFRANDGKVGGPFEGAPMLILHTTGAKSGKERVSPLVFQPNGDRWVIFASKGGAPTHPDWYHNLVAHPDGVSIEVGTDTVDVVATVAEGDEHDQLWEAQKAAAPGFAEYEAKAEGRRIPVVILSRR